MAPSCGCNGCCVGKVQNYRNCQTWGVGGGSVGRDHAHRDFYDLKANTVRLSSEFYEGGVLNGDCLYPSSDAAYRGHWHRDHVDSGNQFAPSFKGQFNIHSLH